MKNVLILSTLALGLFFAFPANAQTFKERKAKLDSIKMEFFNQSLSLTDVEKEKFWPVYNEYQVKTRKLKKDFRSKYKKNDLIYMDEGQANNYLKELNTMKEKELALYKEYQLKFKSFLSAKKVVMIYRTERDWQQKIKSVMRERMKGRK